jgi:hypothetical protein
MIKVSGGAHIAFNREHAEVARMDTDVFALVDELGPARILRVAEPGHQGHPRRR